MKSRMLLQSHAREIQLLPALPKAWAAQGAFNGLRAHAGFTVDCTWKDGKVTRYSITAEKSTPVTVRINGELMTINIQQ